MNNRRDQVTALFQAFSGQARALVIPRPYLDLCGGDHLAALLLSQILYWADRSNDPQGWFSHSYDEWAAELAMSEYQIKRAINGDKRSKAGFALSSVGVETSLKQSKHHNGAATLHYRVDYAKLEAAIRGLYPDLNNVQNGNPDPNNVQIERKSIKIRSEQCSERSTKSIEQDHELGLDHDLDRDLKNSGAPANAGAAPTPDHGKVIPIGKTLDPKPKRTRKPDPIYDAVALYWFGKRPGTPEFAALGGRIANIVKWLKGNEISVKRKGGTVNVPAPEHPGPITPDVIRRAAQDCRAEKGRFMPQDALKMVEWLAPWLRKQDAAAAQADAEQMAAVKGEAVDGNVSTDDYMASLLAGGLKVAEREQARARAEGRFIA